MIGHRVHSPRLRVGIRGRKSPHCRVPASSLGCAGWPETQAKPRETTVNDRRLSSATIVLVVVTLVAVGLMLYAGIL